MISVIRFCTISIVLHVSIHTKAQVQESPELFVKGFTNSSTLLPINEADTISVIERDTSYMQIETRLRIAATRLKEKAAGIADYVNANDFNPDYCFLVDMSIPSGKKRFFVYNIKLAAVEYSALVSHGSGSYFPGCNDLLVFFKYAKQQCYFIR